MAENEHSPFETPLHKIYEKELCLSPIPSLSYALYKYKFYFWFIS